MTDVGIRKEIIKDVIKFRKKYGKISRNAYFEKSEYPFRQVYKIFGTWSNLMIECDGKEELSVEELKEAIRIDYITLYNQLGKHPSREDFKRFSNFSYHQIKKAFYSINEIKDYCGNISGPIPPKFQKSLIKQEASDENKIYINEIISYRGKYLRPNNKKHKILMVASDFHDRWVDPFALKVWLDAVKRVQPDYICLAGDVFDFYQVSSFSQDPRRVFDLQKDIDFTIKNILTPTRKASPNSQIDLLIGNHEFRLIKFLMNEARGLASLNCLRFGELFKLDKNKINLVCHDRFTENKNVNNDKNYIIYDDCFIVSHGTSTGTNHAINELSKWGVSGCSGHVHHFQESRFYRKTTRQSKTDVNGEMKWISLGCMCSMESGEEYIKDIVRWQQGFLITHIFPKNKSVINEYIEIVENKAFIGGKLYDKRK